VAYHGMKFIPNVVRISNLVKVKWDARGHANTGKRPGRFFT
jgi:hypothetical protein